MALCETVVGTVFVVVAVVVVVADVVVVVVFAVAEMSVVVEDFSELLYSCSFFFSAFFSLGFASLELLVVN